MYRFSLIFFLSATLLIKGAYAMGSKPLTLPPAEDIRVRSSVADLSDYPDGAPYLLLSCVDFRLQNEMGEFMVNRGLLDKYDNIVLPGASIGVDNPEKPAWKSTFNESLATLKKLHDIKGVILMDHRNCGMYNIVYGRDISKDPHEEYELHKYHMTHVKEMIKSNHPDLKVESLLMDLDGKVHTVDPLN